MSIRSSLPLAVPLALALAIALVPHTTTSQRSTADSDSVTPGSADALSPVPGATPERLRIALHLARVESELRARDVTHLGRAQQQARAALLDELRAYRIAGRYPYNHDFAGARVPYFIDDHGTLCAMAHLIAYSGRADMVRRVAASRNNARIAELAGDTDLIAWLDHAGLSVEEAALIQPWYDYLDPAPQPEPRFAGYAVATALGTGLGAAAVRWNVPRQLHGERWPGVFGVASGTYSLALGAAGIEQGGNTRSLGYWNVAVGALVTTLGVRTLFAPGAPVETASRAAIREARAERSVRAAPLLTASGAAGVGLTVSF